MKIALGLPNVPMDKDGNMASLSIPNHDEVAKGILRSLIRASDLTVDKFIELIRKQFRGI